MYAFRIVTDHHDCRDERPKPCEGRVIRVTICLYNGRSERIDAARFYAPCPAGVLLKTKRRSAFWPSPNLFSVQILATIKKGTALGAIFYGRGERIRTSGLFVPNEARYQAALHPDIF